MGLSMAERRAVTKQMARRYRSASKREKGRMLDELCALTGWTRRHARRALIGALQPPSATPRSPRPRTYGAEVVEALRFVWATLDGPAGKRLAPFMREVVEALERHGELELAPEVRTPYQRVLDSAEVAEGSKVALRQTYLGLNPAQLKRDIGRCQDRLIDLAGTNPDRGREVKPPPGHPWKASFGRQRSRTSLVRQPAAASRTS